MMWTRCKSLVEPFGWIVAIRVTLFRMTQGCIWARWARSLTLQETSHCETSEFKFHSSFSWRNCNRIYRADLVASNAMTKSPWNGSDGVAFSGILLSKHPYWFNLKSLSRAVSKPEKSHPWYVNPYDPHSYMLSSPLGVLMRALYTHYTRSAPDSKISQMIRTFLSIQACLTSGLICIRLRSLAVQEPSIQRTITRNKLVCFGLAYRQSCSNF